MSLFWTLIYDLLQIFFFLLIARLVLDYVQMFARSWRPTGVVLVLAEIIYSITDPPLRLLRKVLRPVRVGSVMLDLAFIGLTILVLILRQLNAYLFLR